MKKFLYSTLLAIVLFPFYVDGQQNHVPNGNFEYYTTCLTGILPLDTCIGWVPWNIGSPDYYHTCASTVPSSAGGYQYAASGNGYAGFYSFITSNNKEYIGRPIIPLQRGQKYEVSISVSLSNISQAGTNDLGILFYDQGPTMSTTTTVPTFPIPQVEWFNTIITDTQNWVRLSKIFTPDSAYDNILIGGFKTPSNISYTSINGNTNFAYYLIDSVVVKPYDSLFLVFNDTVLCTGNTIHVNYVSTKTKQSNNVFTLQLSNASGSFTSPVNIGSVSSDTSGSITGVIPVNTPTGQAYKIRVVASQFPDTSEAIHTLKIGNGASLSKPVADNNSPICNNDTLKLVATTNTQGVLWQWKGPNNYISNLQNPIIINPGPLNAGIYVVTARLYGCTAKDTTNAIITTGSGSFGTLASSNTPCINDTLKLSGSTNGNILTYSWTGPGNFSSNQQNPVLPFVTSTASGSYILNVSTGNCTASDTITIVIKPRPANFTSTSNAPLCTGTAINFTASSTSTGVTYAWSGPNSFNSTSANTSIGGASSVHNGDYYITATLNGCSLSDTLPVTVNPLPVKPVANSNTPVCAGDNVQLTVGSASNTSYAWTGPASFNSTSQNPVRNNTTTTMSGDYIITIDSNGCTNKDTTTVLVKPSPTTVTTSNNTPLCAGDTLKLFSTASSSNTTYTWSGPASHTAGTQNSSRPNATTAMTGWYKMSVDLNGCTTTDSTYATVYAIPSVPTISYNNPLCVGETLNLNATTVSGATYSWTGPGNYSANTQNPMRTNMQFGDTGMYKVIVTANGCSAAETALKVDLNANPFVVILANPGDSICQGDPVVFTALPNNHGGTPNFQWKVNAQNAGTGSVFNTGTLNNGDVILCEMTENTKCSVPFKDESNDIQMTVLPWLAPSVSITANPNHPLDQYEYVTFTAVATDAGKNPKYQWKRNGQDIVGATGSTWSANTLNDNDSISVEIISDYKCPQPTTAKSNWIKVQLTGVDDIASFGGLKLYPNPNKGKFLVEAPPFLPQGEVMLLQVINTLGQVVYSDNIVPVNGVLHKEIDLQNIISGVYLLRVKSSDGKSASLRFRVE